MISSFQARLFHRFFSVLGALALAVSTLPYAMADSLCEYEVSIASSERLLNAEYVYGLGTGNYERIQKAEACDNPHYRVQARNRPAVLVQNDSQSEGNLLRFVMMIEEADYVFGTGDGSPLDGFDGKEIKRSVYMDPDVLITGSEISPDGKTLTVEFAGLKPGESALFRVDLDWVEPAPIYGDLFPYPDFRMVLFGEENPGQTKAEFLLGDKECDTDFDSLTGRAGDGSQDTGCCASDKVITGEGGGAIGVPEPASLLLLLAGLVSTSMLRRTRR